MYNTYTYVQIYRDKIGQAGIAPPTRYYQVSRGGGGGGGGGGGWVSNRGCYVFCVYIEAMFRLYNYYIEYG